MALFKITRGAESELPSSYHDGYAYFCTDTGSFYIDYGNEPLPDGTPPRIKITAGKADALVMPKDSSGNSIATGSGTEPVYISANGIPVKCTYKLNATVPSNAKFTDTDTKVTSVGNHYTPAANNASQLSADAANGSSATWNSTNFVTGVNLQRDAKGHVVGVTVDSAKMPANPNVDTNTAHEHIAGVGLAIEGENNIISGEVTYKAKLKSETPLNVDSVTPTSVGGTYPVVADKSGNLAVSTPNATTSAKGVVQLTSTIDTSTDKAATPAAVKSAYDLANTAKSIAESKPSSTHKHTVSHTPAGTISAPTFTSTTTSTGNNTTIDTPTLTASINSKCLTITFTTGSYAHTHNLNITGTVSAPTFTGTAATLTTSTAIDN